MDLLRTSETEKAEIMSKLREVERERNELKEEIEEYQDNVESIQQESDALRQRIQELSSATNSSLKFQEQCERMAKELLK